MGFGNVSYAGPAPVLVPQLVIPGHDALLIAGQDVDGTSIHFYIAKLPVDAFARNTHGQIAVSICFESTGFSCRV
jgi:hypothetical protein